MTLPITMIRPAAALDAINLQPAQSGSAVGGAGSFGSFLANAIGQTDQTQKSSQAGIDRFLSGENEEVHQVAIQTQQTQLDFDMFMAVRNKVVSAYQEVMRMQM